MKTDMYIERNDGDDYVTQLTSTGFSKCTKVEELVLFTDEQASALINAITSQSDDFATYTAYSSTLFSTGQYINPYMSYNEALSPIFYLRRDILDEAIVECAKQMLNTTASNRAHMYRANSLLSMFMWADSARGTAFWSAVDKELQAVVKRNAK